MSLHSGTLSRPRANDYLHFLLNQFYNLSFNPIRDRTHTYLSKREDFDSFNWFNFDTFLCLTQVRAISSVVFIHVYWCLSFHSCVLMFEFSFMCIDVWVFIHVYWCLSFHSCVLMFEFDRGFVPYCWWFYCRSLIKCYMTKYTTSEQSQNSTDKSLKETKPVHIMVKRFKSYMKSR
jgi:hypothetical protein